MIALGSNLGARCKNLNYAKNFLCKYFLKVKESKIIETESFYFANDSKYLNQIILFKTNYDPYKVLFFTRLIEKLVGRKFNTSKNSPRLIDIDIISIDSIIIDSFNLKLPHPLMHERPFVLGPLLEVFENWIHPITSKSVSQMLRENID